MILSHMIQIMALTMFLQDGVSYGTQVLEVMAQELSMDQRNLVYLVQACHQTFLTSTNKMMNGIMLVHTLVLVVDTIMVAIDSVELHNL